MKTSLKHKSPTSSAAECIQKGKLVAFPTETVYGLGADATNPDAVSEIYNAKKRPADNPLIIHVDSQEMLDRVVAHVDAVSQSLIDQFWPGPLTLIFKRQAEFSAAASAGLDTVAVRMPNHQIALELISKSGRPIAAPSANISGRPSPTSYEDLLPEILSHCCAAIDGGKCKHGLESTVVKVASGKIDILRYGAISPEEIAKVSNSEIVLPNSDVENIHQDEKPHSPGTKYKHYQPRTPLLLIARDRFIDAVSQQLSENPDQAIGVICASELNQKLTQNLSNEQFKTLTVFEIGSVNDLAQVGMNLFVALNALDKHQLAKAFVHDFPLTEQGHAIMDKLTKATHIYS